MEGKLPTRFNKLRWLSWCLIFAVLFNVLGISGIMIARAVTAPYTFDVANSTWKTSIDQRQLTQGKTMYYNQVTNTVNMTDAGGTAYTVTATWQYHGPTPVQFFIRSTPVNVMVLKDIYYSTPNSNTTASTTTDVMNKKINYYALEYNTGSPTVVGGVSATHDVVSDIVMASDPDTIFSKSDLPHPLSGWGDCVDLMDTNQIEYCASHYNVPESNPSIEGEYLRQTAAAINSNNGARIIQVSQPLGPNDIPAQCKAMVLQNPFMSTDAGNKYIVSLEAVVGAAGGNDVGLSRSEDQALYSEFYRSDSSLAYPNVTVNYNNFVGIYNGASVDLMNWWDAGEGDKTLNIMGWGVDVNKFFEGMLGLDVAGNAAVYGYRGVTIAGKAGYTIVQPAVGKIGQYVNDNVVPALTKANKWAFKDAVTALKGGTVAPQAISNAAAAEANGQLALDLGLAESAGATPAAATAAANAAAVEANGQLILDLGAAGGTATGPAALSNGAVANIYALVGLAIIGGTAWGLDAWKKTSNMFAIHAVFQTMLAQMYIDQKVSFDQCMVNNITPANSDKFAAAGFSPQILQAEQADMAGITELFTALSKDLAAKLAKGNPVTGTDDNGCYNGFTLDLGKAANGALCNMMKTFYDWISGLTSDSFCLFMKIAGFMTNGSTAAGCTAGAAQTFQ